MYDWTWGELVDYIEGKQERAKEKARLDASMLFRTSSLIARMVSAQRGQKFDVMTEFDFLWTDRERYEAKVQRMLASLPVQGGNPFAQHE